MSQPPKLVSVTINDKVVQVPETATVFQAAERAGMAIPHYCYHPDLPIAGQCRMCLVEIEKMPRLQISCNTRVAEGMVVKTKTDKVKEAVKGVLELHLVNHPLDCPICDKAGECGLQNFYVDYGLYQSRMDLEKVHKPKVVDIGTIILDSERCILCTRCVRFTSDVTKTDELVVVNRGDRSELKTYDGGPLRNDYTGNLADICPVGALTAKDFRFECRVWFLEKTKSTCTLCARGCNTVVSVKPKTKTLYRVEPRRNPKVNKSWICDEGRWGYHYVADDKRILEPALRSESGSAPTNWETVFKTLQARLGAKTLVVLSAQMTNEEAADAIVSLKGAGVTDFSWVVEEKVVGETEPYDGVLRHRDRAANAAGLQRMFQVLETKFLRIPNAIERISSYDDVWFLGLEGHTPPGLDPWLRAVSQKRVLVHATSWAESFERAEFVIPNTSSYEKSGTLINALGRFQKLQAVLPKQGLARNVHEVVFGMLRGDDREICEPARMEKMYDEVTRERLLKLQMPWRSINAMGIPLMGTEERLAETI